MLSQAAERLRECSTSAPYVPDPKPRTLVAPKSGLRSCHRAASDSARAVRVLFPRQPTGASTTQLCLARQLPASFSEREFIRLQLEGLFGASDCNLTFVDVSHLHTLQTGSDQNTSVDSFFVEEKLPAPNNDDEKDFHANVGRAIRTLREEIPLLFVEDLTYDIYRKDIVFRDPRNCFKGMKNYKTIFWSLRFHGRIFFKSLYVEVKRIWQIDDTCIRMRWQVHGIPRVPWEAEGIFDGVSTFKLDRMGLIYEHAVDNVILRDPPMLTNPLFARLNLIPAAQSQPYPGAWFEDLPQESRCPSMVEVAVCTTKALVGSNGSSFNRQPVNRCCSS